MEGIKFTDIHCHILPGADDGASDFNEAVSMLLSASAEGIGKIIATPHQKPERPGISQEGIKKRMRALEAEAEKLGIRIYPGGELFYRQGMENELETGRLPTLAGSGYVLVEFYPQEQFSYIRDGLYRVMTAGFWPILAHTERYEHVCRNREQLDELLEMGCYCQVNAGSLTGEHGLLTKRRAWRLLKEKAAHFVATDAHRSTGGRSPRLKRCASMIEGRCGRAYAEKLLFRNAEAIFLDQDLPV